MAHQKYCYVIVHKENGEMLGKPLRWKRGVLDTDNEILPIYWNRNIATDVCNRVGGYVANKYVVHKLLLTDLQTMILNSKKA